MKKVCVASFCEWNSFGSVLQALALQRTLKAMECDVFTVRPGKKPLPQWHWSAPGGTNIKKWIMALYPLLIGNQIRSSYRRNLDFIDKHVNLVHYQDAIENDGGVPAADVYLSGSDQVWNPLKIRPEFFLDFAPEGKKRCSYAASMGVTAIPEGKEALFRELIWKFDVISVREEDNAAVIGQYTDIPVRVHIDPVFLLSREDWTQYSSPCTHVKKPYILVYALYWDKSLNEQLRRLHQRTGMDIIAVSDHLQLVYATKRIHDADVGQFLWLIDHAEAVVSSSFHGVALSVIFNKKLTAVINPKAPSRLECLLKNLNVEDMAIPALAGECSIQYDAVNQRIAEESKKSKAYLSEVLQTS